MGGKEREEGRKDERPWRKRKSGTEGERGKVEGREGKGVRETGKARAGREARGK